MLVLPYPPSANRYWRHAKGRTYKSEEACAYQEAVGRQCTALGLRPEGGPVCVQLIFYRPRRSGDLDNRIKQCLDALQGYVFVDDAQVVELHAYLCDDKHAPRVEVQWDLAQYGVTKEANGACGVSTRTVRNWRRSL